MVKYLLIAALIGSALVGCSGGADTDVSKKEEQDFRNPPKGIPPDIAAQMAKSREEGMKKAREAMPKATGQ